MKTRGVNKEVSCICGRQGDQNANEWEQGIVKWNQLQESKGKVVAGKTGEGQWHQAFGILDVESNEKATQPEKQRNEIGNGSTGKKGFY